MIDIERLRWIVEHCPMIAGRAAIEEYIALRELPPEVESAEMLVTRAFGKRQIANIQTTIFAGIQQRDAQIAAHWGAKLAAVERERDNSRAFVSQVETERNQAAEERDAARAELAQAKEEVAVWVKAAVNLFDALAGKAGG